LGKFDKKKHSIDTIPFEIKNIKDLEYNGILGCLVDVVSRFQSMGPILLPRSVTAPKDLLNIAVPKVLECKGEGPIQPIRAISPEYIAYISYLLMHTLCASRGNLSGTAKLSEYFDKAAEVLRNFLLDCWQRMLKCSIFFAGSAHRCPQPTGWC
jgi:hypothetical protein